MPKDTLRLLVIGSPGAGKSRFLRNFLLRSKLGGVVIDPAGEFVPTYDDPYGDDFPGVPERYYRMTRPENDEIAESILVAPPPSLLIMDEAHRFAGRWASMSDPLLETLDYARNLSVNFVLATKHVTLMPSFVGMLPNVILANPPRTKSVYGWFRDAGVDLELGTLKERGEWLWIPQSGKQEVVSDPEALERTLGIMEQYSKRT